MEDRPVSTNTSCLKEVSLSLKVYFNLYNENLHACKHMRFQIKNAKISCTAAAATAIHSQEPHM